MARTLKYGFCSVVWCCVVFLVVFRFDGVRAVNNSSDVTSDVQTKGGDDEESAVEKGMRPFFDMVKDFLAVVQPNRITEQSWLNLSTIVRDGQFQTEQIKDWKTWAKYLVGFVVCAAVGIVYFIVMPIVGLVFCCCRCCGKCGAKSKLTDPKRAGCKRTTFCTLLVVFNTMAFAGLVCIFLSNQILYDKLRNENDMGPTGKLVASVDMVNEFVNTTIDEVETAVLTRFETASVRIIGDITSSAGDSVENALDLLNISTLLQKSRDVSAMVNESQSQLKNVADQLNTLSSLGAMLSDNLTAINNDISSVCTSQAVCPGYSASDYSTSANFSALNRLGTQSANVAKSSNLSQYITDAEGTVETAKDQAHTDVRTQIDSATSKVNDTKKSVKEAVDTYKGDLQTTISNQVEKFRSSVRDAQDDISQYSKYVWYGGLGVGCALLLVVAAYYIGILFGLCGERPGFGAQCCNTGTGANFLMAGVGIFFLLSWLIMLVCTLLFVMGGPIYTELCRYVDDHDPQSLQPFSDAVMEQVNFQKSLFEGKDIDLDLVDILEGCENNSAIYSVLKLDNMVNISQYTDLTAVNAALDDLKGGSFHIPNVTILTTDVRRSLTDFGNAGLDTIPFATYEAEMNKNLTVGNLTQLASQLRTIAGGLTGNQATTLNNAADRLDRAQRNLVVPMQQAEDSLRTSLDYLKNEAHSNIKNSTDDLMNTMQTAQDSFNSDKNTLIRDEVVKLVNVTSRQISGVVDNILTDVNKNIGKCRPVYDSFYSATDAACVVALEPLNGLWFSIGWCLFFLLFCLIFAIKLVGLYRREHEERDFDDPNFNLYQAGKQDSIPMTSRQQSGPPSNNPSEGRGVANGGYEAESYMGTNSEYDYPQYKGGAVNSGYDGYRGSSAPPPYAAPRHSHDGAMNGNPKGKNYDGYRY